jgi:hypothetical protein
MIKETNKITIGHIIVAIAGIALFAGLFLNADVDVTAKSNIVLDIATIEKTVIPDNGIILPLDWGDLGSQMVETGVIDKDKFEAIYASRGGLSKEDTKLLYGKDNKSIVMNRENSGILLNMLWAFGLANKNEILEKGPMVDEKYGGNAGKFASTGGWNISVGDSMNHYSKYAFITLTQEQQDLVERVSKNIYRPCCGNSTYFPDCNHGMAMLGLLELLALEGVDEEEIYNIALAVNSYWFPDTYITLAEYFAQKGIDWTDVDSKEVLGVKYSSGQGYANILEQMEPTTIQKGAGCGV